MDQENDVCALVTGIPRSVQLVYNQSHSLDREPMSFLSPLPHDVAAPGGAAGLAARLGHAGDARVPEVVGAALVQHGGDLSEGYCEETETNT